MITITKEDAIRTLEEAVAERGTDYTYEVNGRCVYASNGKPDCGIGLALTKMGVSVEVLETLDTANGITPRDRKFVNIIGEAGFVMEPEAVTVWARFQTFQDNENSWGYSLERAREVSEYVHS